MATTVCRNEVAAYLYQKKHTLKIEYFNGGGGYYLDAKYKGPGIGKQIIPADKLSQE